MEEGIFIKILRENIIEKGEYCEIKLIYKGKNRTEEGILKVDNDIAYDLIGLNVCLINVGYAYITNKNIRTSVHRYIIKANEGDVVDHIDGDRLNNLRSNLRVCSCSENSSNRKVQRNNKSGRAGVMWYKYIQNPKWVAFISLNGKRKHLGYFDDFEEAVKAREEAERKYFKEFLPKDNRNNKRYYHSYYDEEYKTS